MMTGARDVFLPLSPMSVFSLPGRDWVNLVLLPDTGDLDTDRDGMMDSGVLDLDVDGFVDNGVLDPDIGVMVDKDVLD